MRSNMLVVTAVLSHGLVNAVHAVAHWGIDVWLPFAGNVFVAIVVLIAPLIATWMVWRGRARDGGALLAISMIAGLAFGAWHHFLSGGPEHCASLPPGPWSDLFTATSWLLAISQVIAAFVGVAATRFISRGATALRA